MSGLYLQLANETNVWEEVDLYTWKNWENALDREDKKRYTGNRVSCDAQGITVQGTRLTKRDFAIIARFCGVRDSDAPGSVANGFVRNPEFIRFNIRKKTVVHEVHGRDYVTKQKQETVQVATPITTKVVREVVSREPVME
jgi:hypothetical protein